MGVVCRSYISNLSLYGPVLGQDLSENGYSFKEFSSFQITRSILLTNLIFHKTGSEKPGSSRGGATRK
jgi:hypothetical protein